MATAQPQAAPTGHAGAITALALDADRLFSGGADGAVIAWNLDDLTPRHPPDGKPRPAITALAAARGVVGLARADGTIDVHGVEQHLVSPALAMMDDDVLLVADAGGMVHRWDPRSLEPVAEPLRVPAPRCVAGRGGVIAAGTEDGVLVLWGPEPWEGTPATDHGAVTAVAVLEGPEVVTGSEDGVVRLWTAPGTFEAIAPGAPVTALDARHAGGHRVVASGHADGALQVVFGDKERIVTIETGTKPVRAVALAPVDGRLVAVTGGADGRLHRWELEEPDQPGGRQPDKVEWLTDAPADEDLLRRRPLARALARRLERIREGEPGRSFLIHIDGAWGTGKSTIMRYLAQELEDRWLVVDFNAWRRSRVGPPWWALLVAMRTAVADRLGPFARTWLRLREATARARRTGAPYLLAVLALVAIAAAVIVVLKPDGLKDAGDIAGAGAAVLGGLGTLWAGGLVAARLLLWDSAKGAKVYEQSESDPMEQVVEHFAWLARRAGRPVLFFVDDLDRCSGDYVVDLLEAVQTLVRDADDGPHGTYFVVAADGSWVRTAYERRYADFAASVGEPGRPLGYLFLDKLFQLTVRVPSVSALDQSHFLAGLLAVRGKAADHVADEVKAAEQRIAASETDADVVAVLEEASDAAREVLRSSAVERLSDAGVQAATEHALEKFAELLEPNPRAMKRFVNAFGLARVVLTLEDVLVPFDVLALWTILSTRWPMLADRLREHPEEVELVGERAAEAADAPDDVRALLASPEVAEVVRFHEGGPLTRELVEECVTGRSAKAAPAR